MTKIEITEPVTFGDAAIDAITIDPLHFVTLVKTWARPDDGLKPEVSIQRQRILHQARFMSGDKRIVPDVGQLANLPYTVAKAIIAALDIGQGPVGEVIGKGDGVFTPILYRLGTPIEMKSSKDGLIKISELEFKVSSYGQAEDILAAGSSADKVIALLTTVANPVQVETMPRLPSWAIDRITVADGVTIMRDILPNF